MPWFAYKNNASGYLYYDTVLAFSSGPDRTGDPWTSVYAAGGNGDGTLFYPGTPTTVSGGSSFAIGPAPVAGQPAPTNIPIASLRLKMVREGLEDYEYMTMLGPSAYDWITQNLMPMFYPNAWDTDPVSSSGADNTDNNINNLYAARHMMACQILAQTPGAVQCSTTTTTKPPPPTCSGQLCCGGAVCASAAGSCPKNCVAP